MANPRCYGIQVANVVASPTKTSITTTATAAIRPEWYDIYVGSGATPADNALVWQSQRYTAAGTNTSYTPTPNDPGDPAATTIGGITNSVEPTYTSNQILWQIAENQRAIVRAILDPRGPLKMPATANNGLGLGCTNSSFTGNCNATVFFNE